MSESDIQEDLEVEDQGGESDESLEPAPEEVDNHTYLRERLTTARAAARPLSVLTAATKNMALHAMADGLEEATDDILAANEEDLNAFGDDPARAAMADRLKLTPERVKGMATQIREIAALRDPVGESLGMWQRPNGMKVGRIRVPIGVIAIIYESRPNVTADAAALCLKSGNVCVLRGGSEAVHSNTAIAAILEQAAQKAEIPPGAITFIARPDRDVVIDLLKRDEFVDLVIPRGGSSLMETVTTHATIPVVKHDKGVCHIYVDADADLAQAQAIVLNAKTQRPSTCNALEGLLVHEKIARSFLEGLAPHLRDAKVEVRGCPKTCGWMPDAVAAQDEDYGQEFLNLTLAVRVVKDMEQAMEHIETHGSRHTESILTNDYQRALRFLRHVDASAVMINASTRLNDGYEFGLGAEMGISTTRIHARGPMGLEDLTCAKYIVFGSGQLRE